MVFQSTRVVLIWFSNTWIIHKWSVYIMGLWITRTWWIDPKWSVNMSARMLIDCKTVASMFRFCRSLKSFSALLSLSLLGDGGLPCLDFSLPPFLFSCLFLWSFLVLRTLPPYLVLFFSSCTLLALLLHSSSSSPPPPPPGFLSSSFLIETQ